VPGATATYVQGINDTGEIVGVYFDAQGIHGFLATPATVPEPAPLTLFVGGVLGVLAARHRPRRNRHSLRRCLHRVAQR
jgi:hypothetical protein